MQEDLSVFTEGEFSSTAVINGVELKGIFDESYSPAFDSTTEGDRISFLIQTVQALEINHGDSVELEEREFEVKGKQKIEDGKLTELILKEIA